MTASLRGARLSGVPFRRRIARRGLGRPPLARAPQSRRVGAAFGAPLRVAVVCSKVSAGRGCPRLCASAPFSFTGCGSSGASALRPRRAVPGAPRVAGRAARPRSFIPELPEKRRKKRTTAVRALKFVTHAHAGPHRRRSGPSAWAWRPKIRRAYLTRARCTWSPNGAPFLANPVYKRGSGAPPPRALSAVANGSWGGGPLRPLGPGHGAHSARGLRPAPSWPLGGAPSSRGGAPDRRCA